MPGAASAFVSPAAEYNGVSPERTGFSLGEAWMDWNAGGFQLRLGRQLVSWGAVDGIVLTDVVCPPNLSAYAGLDFAGSRLPVDGLRLRYGFSSFAVEALWLPLFTPARLPGDEQNPLYGVLYPASVDTGAGGGALPVRVSEAAPPRSLGDGEYGLRFSAYTPVMDVSCALFYGWNDVPYFDKKLGFSGAAPAGLELTPGYARTLMMGLDWNPSGWTLSAQYYEDLLPDAYGGGTARPWRKNALTLRIGRSFFRELLSLSAWCYLDLRDFDAAAGASAAWALSDSLSLTLGSDFFTGGIDNRGDYGAYRDLSCLWVKGVFRF